MVQVSFSTFPAGIPPAASPPFRPRCGSHASPARALGTTVPRPCGSIPASLYKKHKKGTCHALRDKLFLRFRRESNPHQTLRRKALHMKNSERTGFSVPLIFVSPRLSPNFMGSYIIMYQWKTQVFSKKQATGASSVRCLCDQGRISL